MAHECGCHARSVAATQRGGAPITADRTAGDVTHHHAGTLDTMKESDLTLREAAVSAGVALDVLLDALNRPATVKG